MKWWKWELMLATNFCSLCPEVINFGCQTFGCQIWFCTRLFTYGDEVIHKAWWGIGEVPYCFSRSFVKFQGHMGQKISNFHPNLVFPDCNSSLNWLMAMIWCTQLEVALKRCLIVLQGHLSNFKVTRDKKESPILTWIWCFRTVTPVWIDRWLSNDDDAQSLKYHRRGALLIFKVIHQISRSHRTKITNFDLNWAFPEGNSSLNSLMALK